MSFLNTGKSPVELIAPYGGRLVDLLVSAAEREELIQQCARLDSFQLTPRSLCDLELLGTGAFSPLSRFMGREDYLSVLESMRLKDGALFPIPVTLTVADASRFSAGHEIALRSPKNNLLAWMRVEEIFERNSGAEEQQVCGTRSEHHPLVAEMRSWGTHCLSGELRLLRLPEHYDFPELRHTPRQVRELLSAMGSPNIVAFQAHAAMHRSHEELTKRAAAEANASLLLHAVTGITKPGDMEHFTRVRTYKALVDGYFDPASTLLSLLPLAVRQAGPREAVWHAIIRRNYGASHFIVGPDYASPGDGGDGKRFYGAHDAQELAARFAAELGVRVLPADEMVYLPDEARYEPAGSVPRGTRTVMLSATEVRENYLAVGRPLPEWFTRPETSEILASAHPPRHKQGFCVWFTGLPSAGKSTIADLLTVMLMEHGRQVTVLDGDVVRTHLSKGLGFSREDRDTNILRIGFVAAEIVRQHGAAVCAAVSPYRATRNQVRAMMGEGHFIEVFVDTPVDVCEQRDVKGFYGRARAGQLKGFTGVDDPYEVPLHPELRLLTVTTTPEENAKSIVDFLIGRGLLLRDSPRGAAEREVARVASRVTAGVTGASVAVE